MEFLEIIIILIILCAQGYVAYLAWGQIESIGHFLKSENNLKLKQTKVSLEDVDCKTEDYISIKSPLYLGVVLENTTKEQFFSFCPKYDIKKGDKVTLLHGDGTMRDTIIVDIIYDNSYVDFASASQNVKIRLGCNAKDGSTLLKTATVAETAKIEVSTIILHKNEQSILLKDVVKTINNYLKKNKGGAADFHLIKDIVERHTDSIDEEINHKLPVPIYLGLMGTVLGIIIGLYSLSFEYNPATNALDGELFVNSVDGLITGVKQAMICSFVGLGLTTLLSSWRYMGAKSKL